MSRCPYSRLTPSVPLAFQRRCNFFAYSWTPLTPLAHGKFVPQIAPTQTLPLSRSLICLRKSVPHGLLLGFAAIRRAVQPQIRMLPPLCLRVRLYHLASVKRFAQPFAQPVAAIIHHHIHDLIACRAFRRINTVSRTGSAKALHKIVIIKSFRWRHSCFPCDSHA